MESVAGSLLFFFSSRRRHTRLVGDWSSDVCSSDLDSVNAPAPVAVTVEIRAPNGEGAPERVWRLARAIGEEGVLFERPLPWEPGRPVALALRLPGADAIDAAGRIAAPDAVAWTTIDPEARRRIIGYVQERMLE